MPKDTSVARKLFRDTVDRIEMGYAVTGLQPMRLVRQDGRGNGCALGAVDALEGRRVIVLGGLGDSGIADGFNGSPSRYYDDQHYRLGFAIGRYAAKRVFAPAPKEPACNASGSRGIASPAAREQSSSFATTC